MHSVVLMTMLEPKQTLPAMQLKLHVLKVMMLQLPDNWNSWMRTYNEILKLKLL
jgi:hypothetical protein